MLALAAAAVLVFGASLAVGYLQWGGGHQAAGEDDPTDSPSASASATNGSNAVPDDWERYDDPVGFSLSLPKGWKRSVSIDQDGIRQVDYSPDRGKHLVRVAVDTDPDFRTSYEHLTDLDQRVSPRLLEYKRLVLKEEVFRDEPGARWEYTWNALAKDGPHYFPGPYHAIDVGYMKADDTEYAVYASSPADDWPTTKKQFNWILRSFQEG